MDKLTEANKRIKELEANSTNLLSYIVRLSNTYTISPELHFELQEVARQSPQRSISKIKADAIREYVHHIQAPNEFTASYGTFIDELLEYADELENK